MRRDRYTWVRASSSELYRTLWRWHFYAGLFVIPFVMVLALSGSIFLFKPQIERWEERAYQGLPLQGAVAPRLQAEAALSAFPGSRLHSYRLPQHAGDAAMLHLALPEQGAMRDVFVSPRGEVLGSVDPDARLIAVVRRIHGQLLLGPRGSWLVELAASWAIVMVVTGLYLWWPRGSGPAGVLWPRRRSLLRDLHAVTGFWAAGFALLLLLTALPWTDVWGSAFSTVRQHMGWVKGAQGWSIGGRDSPASGLHAHHDHAAMHGSSQVHDMAMLDVLAPKARAESLAFPVLVLAPGASQFMAPPSPDWIVKSDSQDRTLGVSIRYDVAAGEEIAREGFADGHVIDRVVGYGISWHEGQLFGWINQLVGVLTALALSTMTLTAFLMWRRRRPAGQLGAPPLPGVGRRPAIVAVAMLVLAAVLPLLAASLVLLWLFDRIVPRISPAAANWLGLDARARRTPS